MKCAYCDNQIPPNATTCPACGAPAPTPPAVSSSTPPQPAAPAASSSKSASTATILSCLIIGLGQMYLGQVAKGVTLLLLSIIISSATAGFGGLFFWLFAMIDANKIGKKLEAGHTVKPWEFF